MEGIVILLLIIGLVARSQSNKKKKAQRERARQAGFDQAAPPPLLRKDAAEPPVFEGEGRPSVADKIAGALEAMDEQAGQIKLPHSKPQWAAFLRDMDAGEHLDQRGLTCAVFTDQTMNLAGLDLDMHILHSDNAGESLGDMFKFHYIFSHDRSLTPF